MEEANKMKSKKFRHLEVIEDSKKMGISQELPKIVSTLFRNIKEDKSNQYKMDGNLYATACGYPKPYPNL